MLSAVSGLRIKFPELHESKRLFIGISHKDYSSQQHILVNIFFIFIVNLCLFALLNTNDLFLFVHLIQITQCLLPASF